MRNLIPGMNLQSFHVLELHMNMYSCELGNDS